MTLILAVAALAVAAAALVLAIIVMRQSGAALAAARRATRHADRLTELEDDVEDVQAYTAQLGGWAGDAEDRLTGLAARVGLPGQPTPRPGVDLADALEQIRADRDQPPQFVVVEHPLTADQAAQIRDHLRAEQPHAVDVAVPPGAVTIVDGTGATVWTRPEHIPADQPTTAHLERPDLPTTAMPATDRPEVRP